MLSRSLPRFLLQAGLLIGVAAIAAAFGKWLMTRSAGARESFPELIVSA